MKRGYWVSPCGRGWLIEGSTFIDCPTLEIGLNAVRDVVVRDNIVRNRGWFVPL
jgi:hypothetical protein